jgi:1-acyl-sn-glycerol-3-phosphate acyltransferase
VSDGVLDRPEATGFERPTAWRLARSLVTHVVVFLGVLVFGPIATVLSPFTGGQIVFWLGVIWSRINLVTAGVRLEVEGVEKVRKGEAQIIVANHGSNFDIYAMIPALKGHYYRFIAKKEILYLPIFGWALWAGGFPFVDRGHSAKAQATLRKVQAKIRRTGMSILAFPEGTRNTRPGLLPFKKGAFILAIDLGVPLVPVAIHGAKGTIRVEFLDPIPTKGLTYDDRDALIARTRGAIEAALGDEIRRGVS